MAGVQLQRSNPPRTFTTDDEAYGQERLSFMSLGAWGQKRPQNRGVWALALLGSWVAGMSVPLAGGEGGAGCSGAAAGVWSHLTQMRRPSR